MWTRIVAGVIGVALVVGVGFIAWQTHRTSRALTRLESGQHQRAARTADVADFASTFFSASCEQQMTMERFPLERFSPFPGKITRSKMAAFCEALNGKTQRRVLDHLSVLGGGSADHVRALATLRFPSRSRSSTDTGAISYLDLTLVHDGGRYLLTGLSEFGTHAP
jgi:hypothetical protein